MQRLLVLALVLSSTVCATAQASDFRFCEMEGAVESAVAYRGDKARTFDLVVRVGSSRREEGKNGELGYTDCSEYVDLSVDIRLQIPRRYGEPARGDHIRFNYSSIDGFDANGKFAGTSISAVLLEYRKQKP